MIRSILSQYLNMNIIEYQASALIENEISLILKSLNAVHSKYK